MASAPEDRHRRGPFEPPATVVECRAHGVGRNSSARLDCGTVQHCRGPKMDERLSRALQREPANPPNTDSLLVGASTGRRAAAPPNPYGLDSTGDFNMSELDS